MKKGISVIVCCYNSARRLQDTLSHLILQKTNGFDWEIIVVDNASTDNTSEIAQRILSNSQTPSNFKVIYEPEPGLINARNRGYDNASFNFLLYCDDDNWLSDTYLQTAYELMSGHEKMAILGGFGEAVFEEQKPAWFDTCKLNFAVGDQAPDYVNEDLVQLDKVYGAGFMVRRELFETLKSLHFNSLLSGRKGNQLISGEDNELCWAAKQLGYEIWYSKKLRFKHLMTPGRMKWGYLKKLYFGFGRANIYISTYNHFENNNQLPSFNLLLPFWIDRFLHKMKALLRFMPKVVFHLLESGNQNVLRFWGMLGELYEIYKLKGKYNEIFRYIRSMLRALHNRSLNLSNNDIRFSIILPTFNRAHFINKAIESVLNQSFQNWELIIIDDGSTDTTRDVIMSYVDSRVKYFWQENQERSVARNNGIEKSRGEFICFIDSDDVWREQHLEILNNTILQQENKRAFYFTAMCWNFPEGKVDKVFDSPKKRNPVEYVIDNQIATPCSCLHRSLLEENQFNESIRINEDVELFSRIVSKYPLIQIPKVTVDVIVHNENTKSLVRDYINPQIQVMNLIIRNPDLKKNISKKFIRERFRKLRHQLIQHYLESSQILKMNLEIFRFLLLYPYDTQNKSKFVLLIYHLPGGSLIKRMIRLFK